MLKRWADLTILWAVDRTTSARLTPASLFQPRLPVFRVALVSARVEWTYPLQLLLLLFVGWIHRSQQDAIDYLREENRVLDELLGTTRPRLTNAQRCRLARKGKVLGRNLLAQVATIVTPDRHLRQVQRLWVSSSGTHEGAQKRPVGLRARLGGEATRRSSALSEGLDLMSASATHWQQAGRRGLEALTSLKADPSLPRQLVACFRAEQEARQ